MPKRSKTCFARIEKLALLPVFHRLSDARVLLVGGSDAAAWKAELMHAAGAQIILIAHRRSDVMNALIAAHPDGFDVRTGDWSPTDFSGVRLAVMDTECDLEAAAFVQAGLMTGVPVNVIDRPDFCQFQFGSIVNRSPAIISISTDGAAPILGQAIRRRIEVVMPKALAGWTELAQKLRPHINATHPAGVARRVFWERFVDRVFSGEEPSQRHLFGTAQMGGRVVFVDAGPGDPELLTIKAMRALQQADVIIFDDTVSAGVLELARREATRTRHADLASVLRHAHAQKTVVSLSATGTTPHIEALRAQAISVDIIPGVTRPVPTTQHSVAA